METWPRLGYVLVWGRATLYMKGGEQKQQREMEKERGGGQKGEVEKKMLGEFGEPFAVLLYYFNFSITLGFIILCSVVRT